MEAKQGHGMTDRPTVNPLLACAERPALRGVAESAGGIQPVATTDETGKLERPTDGLDERTLYQITVPGVPHHADPTRDLRNL